MNLFKRNKVPTDMLAIKTEQLDAVTKESENAVSMVSTAMNRMKLASQKMKDHMEDIDTYCSNLMAVREQLGKKYAHNEAVIANFSKLLCEEDSD